MPIELVKKGRAIAREKMECPHCGHSIIVKYDDETKEVMWVTGASDPTEDGIIQCYNCKAELRWTPPEGETTQK